MSLAPTAMGNALKARLAQSVPRLDARILEAFASVPRELFLPEELQAHAYEDRALPIGLEQTISQPSMIALMLAALHCEPRHRVLEVGSGSGYVLALLSQLGCEVFGVERQAELVERSRSVLRTLGAHAVVQHADGSAGFQAHAPYDRILISAASESIPDAILSELAEGGRLVAPIGDAAQQILVTCERDDKGTLHYRAGQACIFVPLLPGVVA